MDNFLKPNIIVSEEQFEKLVQMIDNPPKNTEAFNKAMKKFKDLRIAALEEENELLKIKLEQATEIIAFYSNMYEEDEED